MEELPRSVSLVLCDQVIFEKNTEKPTLVGCFDGMAVGEFPATSKVFDVFATLTNGHGRFRMEVVATLLATDQEIYNQFLEVTFPDPLKLVHFRYRVRTCSFPSAGMYVFSLRCGNEVVADRRLRVYRMEESA